MEETKSLLNVFERQNPLQGSFIILESKQSLLCFLSINRSRFSLKQRLFYLRNLLKQAKSELDQELEGQENLLFVAKGSPFQV